jgi:hypothetical protein
MRRTLVENGCEALLWQMATTCANPRKLTHFLAQLQPLVFWMAKEENEHELYNQALPRRARVAKLADARDLKSRGAKAPCGFDSRPGHQHNTHGWRLSVNGQENKEAQLPLIGFRVMARPLPHC